MAAHILEVWTHPDRARRAEGGWSLPLVGVILFALVVLAYFFSWKLLLVVAGVVVAGGIGAFLVDTFAPPRQEPRSIDFWFLSDRPLSELADRIRPALCTAAFEYDSENVWEWGEAETSDGLCHLNVSRKRRDPEHPVRITATYRGEKLTQVVREDLGRRLQRALETNVKVGSVEQVRGNEYEFREEDEFSVHDEIAALEGPIFDAGRFSHELVAALSADERAECVQELEVAVNAMLRPASRTFRAYRARLLQLIEDGLVGELGYDLGLLDGAGGEESLWGGQSYFDRSLTRELFLYSAFPDGIELRWGTHRFD